MNPPGISDADINSSNIVTTSTNTRLIGFQIVTGDADGPNDALGYETIRSIAAVVDENRCEEAMVTLIGLANASP